MATPTSGDLRVGVDVGGTFTDLFVLDPRDGSLRTGKTWSRPEEPEAIVEALGELGISPAEIASFCHASTRGINVLVTRTGAATGLLSTRGHRDILDMGRGLRPLEWLWDLDRTRPHLERPLIPRAWRRPVSERVLADGRILVPLDEAEVRCEARWLVEQGIESLAVCYLNSYANPVHEERTREILEKELPGVAVFLSIDIAPVQNEVFRTTAVAIDAYVSPRVDAYVDILHRRLEERGFAGRFAVMKVDGGFATLDAVRGRGVETIHSGPAGGVTAARHLGERLGEPNLLLLDMGGTTADVSVIEEGEVPVTRDYEVELDLFLGVPSVDVRSIGAGGGSIAWVDQGGALRVGPESAGAFPGPACYGHGGTRATVTDAHLVRGSLYPARFLGGRTRLDEGAARRAVKAVGRQLGLGIETAAQGIVDIANANMAGALRDLTVHRGLHPRDFALLVFGAAGPLHGAALGRELGVREVVVPPWPGELSAFGLLVAEARTERMRALFRLLAELRGAELTEIFAELEERTVAALVDQGVAASEVSVQRWMDGMYLGQASETRCALPPGPLDDAAVAGAAEAFERAYERRWGSRLGMPVRVGHIGVNALGRRDVPVLPALPPGDERPPRNAHLADLAATLRCEGAIAPVALPVYERGALCAGNRLRGPALVVQPTSTTLLEPGDVALVDALGNLRIRFDGAAS